MFIKKIVFLFLLLLTFSGLRAQEFKLIVIGGFNASQINGDGLAGFNKYGLQGGLGVVRKVSNRGAWQFEVLYSEKGSRDILNDWNQVQDTLFKVNYIDIPLLYTYFIMPELRVQMGIYAATLTYASYTDTNSEIEYDRMNDFYRLDAGVTGGLEYQFYKQFSVNLRLSQSLTDANKTFESYYHLYTGLSLRYTFQ